jgi:hypothetical protein
MAGTLDALHMTVEELCCQYNRRDAMELRQEARGWLGYVGALLRRPVGVKAHGELLVAGGWLALLAGCVEYDLGMGAAAESSRVMAARLGAEAGHPEIVGWGHEMTAWFSLTQGRFREAVAAARRGQAVVQGSSVQAQLVAEEAKARARLGDSGLTPVLERGRAVLGSLPAPDRPDNHFRVDPAKWDYLAMDVHRLAGDDVQAAASARSVLRDNLAPDGTELSPMRIAECRLTLAFVAGRAGDLEEAVRLGVEGLKDGRQSKVHLRMVARELHHELQQQYPAEAATTDLAEAIRAIRPLRWMG